MGKKNRSHARRDRRRKKLKVARGRIETVVHKLMFASTVDGALGRRTASDDDVRGLRAHGMQLQKQGKTYREIEDALTTLRMLEKEQ